ncbi:unnamed protein product [Darwinula stevensoni]|uniref:RCC1-like domain-containing protein n=1 Tax=Darwinula stevensoni TaxID=69355 RepID=A0A7R8XJ52_9CRUS|nr:unnamed protein product [Darwinula stevensoni]CAG0894072.1 unnamed protein product [Darwinula stevensoni]
MASSESKLSPPVGEETFPSDHEPATKKPKLDGSNITRIDHTLPSKTEEKENCRENLDEETHRGQHVGEDSEVATKTNQSRPIASDTQRPREEESVQLLESSSQEGALEEQKSKCPAGVVLLAGEYNWDICGRQKSSKDSKKNLLKEPLWVFHRVKDLEGIRVQKVVSHCTAAHNILITDQGQALAWGRNDKGQLGVGDTVKKDHPQPILDLKNFTVIDAACGKSHTLVLTESGDVFGFGENKLGQLGLGNENPVVQTPTKIQFDDGPVKKVACGGQFSLMVNSKGALYSFGCPEYGQLGNNTDGKYFVSANRMAFHCELRPIQVKIFIDKMQNGIIIPVKGVRIADIACGTSHSVAVDTEKRVFTWGFGGYGRLGHNETKDEHVPRLVKGFVGLHKGVKKVFAGSIFSLAIGESGGLFLWGQTRRAGEANMYPKPIQDLYGWNILDVGCGYSSIVVAADESVISWGPTPAYGELGHGERQKSSSVPKEVGYMDGLNVHSVTCGICHTLLIARDETEEDHKKLEALPVFKP